MFKVYLRVLYTYCTIKLLIYLRTFEGILSKVLESTFVQR